MEGLQQTHTDGLIETVIWWKNRLVQTRETGLRRHDFGWLVPESDYHGTVIIESQRTWLDRTTTAQLLRDRLNKVRPAGFRLVALDEAAQPNQLDQLDPVSRLRIAGVGVHMRDLCGRYGTDAIAGVVAEHRSRTVWSQAVIERTAVGPTREAAAAWAEQAIGQFGRASTADLIEAGWAQFAVGRWQLICRQR